ncbi:MAG: cytochrome c3 family protein [Eubacteriales bacterium]
MAGRKEGGSSFIQSALGRITMILVIVVVLFGFARQMIIPKSFGQYGRYRGDSVSEVASRPVNYAGGGNSTCGQCHQNVFQALSSAEHGKMDCQTCHGPAAKHVAKPSEQSPKIEGNAELCGACHKDIAGRTDQQIATVTLQMHSGGVACVGCHDPHQPWAKLGGRS